MTQNSFFETTNSFENKDDSMLSNQENLIVKLCLFVCIQL
jgi:hypothetical protein